MIRAMESISGTSQVQEAKDNRRISFCALSLVLLLLLAVNIGSLHHHHDLQAHADCSICLVAHHSPVETTDPPAQAVRLPFSCLLPIITMPVAVISRPAASINGRAPPHY